VGQAIVFRGLPGSHLPSQPGLCKPEFAAGCRISREDLYYGCPPAALRALVACRAASARSSPSAWSQSSSGLPPVPPRFCQYSYARTAICSCVGPSNSVFEAAGALCGTALLDSFRSPAVLSSLPVKFS
jgi:hypothetical protein